MKVKTSKPWPPPGLALPDTIEEIQRGRSVQRGLFARDESREGRIDRLLGTMQGVTKAGTMPPMCRYCAVKKRD